jgi:hypothetical protein
VETLVLTVAEVCPEHLEVARDDRMMEILMLGQRRPDNINSLRHSIWQGLGMRGAFPREPAQQPFTEQAPGKRRTRGVTGVSMNPAKAGERMTQSSWGMWPRFCRGHTREPPDDLQEDLPPGDGEDGLDSDSSGDDGEDEADGGGFRRRGWGLPSDEDLSILEPEPGEDDGGWRPYDSLESEGGNDDDVLAPPVDDDRDWSGAGPFRFEGIWGVGGGADIEDDDEDELHPEFLTVIDVDEFRLDGERVVGRAGENEVSVLMAMARGFFFWWPFLRRPDAPIFREGLVVLIAQLDARFGQGRWVFHHDFASYSSARDIGACLRSRGVLICAGMPRLPLDLRALEVPIHAVKDAIRPWEPRTRRKLFAFAADGMRALGIRELVDAFVDGIPLRFQFVHFLGGEWLPRKVTKGRGLDPGMGFATRLVVPPAPPSAALLERLNGFFKAGTPVKVVAESTGLRPSTVKFWRTQYGLRGDLRPFAYEGAVFRTIFPSYSGHPVVVFTDPLGEHFHFLDADGLAAFPELLEAARASGRDRPPVVVARMSDGRLVLESWPGGPLFRFTVAAAFFGYRFDALDLPTLDVEPSWFSGDWEDDWLATAVSRDEAPEPVEFSTEVLRAGRFVLYQLDDGSRFTVMALADAPVPPRRLVTVTRDVAPAPRDALRVEWFARHSVTHGEEEDHEEPDVVPELGPDVVPELGPEFELEFEPEPPAEEEAEVYERRRVRAPEEVPSEVDERRRARAQELDGIHASADWTQATAELQRLAHSLGGGVLAVGREVLACMDHGEEIPPSRELASLACVDKHRIARHLRELGRLLPWLFGRWVVPRERVFNVQFRARAMEWAEVVADLEDRWLGASHFALALEIAAWRFERPPRHLQSVADLAGLSGVPEEEVAALIERVRNDDSERALYVEFGDGPTGWQDGVTELRRLFSGVDFDVAAVQVGDFLRGRRATVQRVADETGVSYSTVGRHVTAVRGEVERIFPSDLPETRRGRRSNGS